MARDTYPKPIGREPVTMHSMLHRLVRPPSCPFCGQPIQAQLTEYRYGVAFCGRCQRQPHEHLLHIKLAITCGYLSDHWIKSKGLTFWAPQPPFGPTVAHALHQLDPSLEPYDLTGNPHAYPDYTTDEHPDWRPRADGSMPDTTRPPSSPHTSPSLSPTASDLDKLDIP